MSNRGELGQRLTAAGPIATLIGLSFAIDIAIHGFSLAVTFQTTKMTQEVLREYVHIAAQMGVFSFRVSFCLIAPGIYLQQKYERETI